MKFTLFVLTLGILAAINSASIGNVPYTVLNMGIVIINAIFLRRKK